MTQSFYAAVLPPQGIYCAVSIRPGRPGEDGEPDVPPEVRQTFHDSIQDLEARAAVIHSEGRDAYFALATFKERGNRKGTNVDAVRCIFLDLDCGPGKPYVDQADAAQKLRAFINRTGLPLPYVVNSGRGLHVYWPLIAPVGAEQWKVLAERFKRLCLDEAFATDAGLTADMARVLRCPDTSNFKQDPPLPVQVVHTGILISLEALEACLPPAPITAVDLSAARAYGTDDMTRGLAAGEFPVTNFARIVRRSLKGSGCAQITNAVQNAATLEEPLWRAALSIAWRCEDAESAIHTLSRPHPGYSFEATLRKAEGTAGPMTCEWYRANHASGCAGCTQAISSPIMLGRKVEAAAAVNATYVVEQQLSPDGEQDGVGSVLVEIPEYPFPYFRGVNGGVYMRSKDKEGEPLELEIYRYDLYLSGRFFDMTVQGEGEGELVGVNLHTPHDGIRRFVAPVTHLLTKEKMRDMLLKHGVIAINKELDNLMSYFASSIRNLQKRFVSDRTRTQMGWTPDETGFVVGELEYTATGTRLAPPSGASRVVAPLFAQKGDLAEWSRMANFYARPGMEGHALGVFFGFGAPLLRLVGGLDVRGATINLMSAKSGTGKTTAQMVANAIFGHPSELLLKINDTAMSRIQWLGMLNSILVTMDEVTNIKDEDLSEAIYEVPQGRGKHRMEAQSNKLRPNAVSWQTFALMSSNSSLYDKLARLKNTSDGEMRRLLEFRIARPVEVSKEESDEVFGTLANNYGLAGPKFIQYVMQNRNDVIELWNTVQRKLDADLKADQSDRFYSKTIACAITGGIIANTLGLIEIPVGPVYKFAITALVSIRNEVLAQVTDTDMVAQETLVTYINDNVNNTLIITTNPAGGPPAVSANPKAALRMRYEPNTQELWIPATALRDYFVSRQVDVRTALKDLARIGVLKHNGSAVPKRIGAGAVGSFGSMTVRCYCVDGAAVGINEAKFAGAGQAEDTAA